MARNPSVSIGERFDMLVVVGDSGRRTQNKSILWKCRCNCGGVSLRTSADLHRIINMNCGCVTPPPNVTIKHGHTKTPTYVSWLAMKKRCLYERHPAYHNYGGRGIKVCRRWLGDSGFENFLADMGERPDGTTLERRNTNGNYTPSNCRWATRTAQANNTRANRMLRMDGTQTASTWAREYGLNVAVIYERLKRGWSTRAAITTRVSGSD